MKKYSFFATGVIAFIMSVSALSWAPANTTKSVKPAAVITANSVPVSNESLFNQYVRGIYEAAGLGTAGLDTAVFKKAVIGYFNLKHNQQVSKQLVTIVDFTKSSKQNRLWIIDLATKKLLFNTLVAHGQGSGDDMAQAFSNTSESHQSSLGFYVTDETYIGKHGLSLKLNGMDAGFNSNARERAVVLHGAEYVSQNFISQHGRLGRSYGCPALPVELTKSIIDTVKGKTCLYINGPASNYKSNYLNQQVAVADFTGNSGTHIAAASLQASI